VIPPEGCEGENNDCELDVVWNAFIRGFLSSSKISNQGRSIEGITQAFEQSKYLNTSDRN
ncbi:MAG TPA: hypothetical protein DDY13_12240, partial [Cytophagales bacterium]|nr:hypothetical protein [Cytophagales bacterium]